MMLSLLQLLDLLLLGLQVMQLCFTTPRSVWVVQESMLLLLNSLASGASTTLPPTMAGSRRFDRMGRLHQHALVAALTALIAQRRSLRSCPMLQNALPPWRLLVTPRFLLSAT